ncbi:DUF2812 domain-containing protein [Fusibacter ferrireducens]|uniref:DUF2812 domain-containing protein n=1 Tax=Fusibacter ferrireducens TaxID=2785058 RepID=A0ABR9ZUM0_9FIRM|nr:DUF2812 domain-containing protein [Fusibacter ferrireducens]MBF4694157.1 DUF2812 domain-containing protein [Fusibacter ferrireducens]
MNDYKKQFYWWWGWQCDAFEAYLESMALKGWILERTTFAHTCLHFIKAEPTKIRYCVDYQNDIQLSQEYRHIMEDDHWQLVNKLSGWYLWQKRYEAKRPSIFTDKQSLIERNSRLLIVALIATVAQIPLAAIVLSEALRWHPGVRVLLFCLYGLFFGLVGYAIYRLVQQNKRLKI